MSLQHQIALAKGDQLCGVLYAQIFLPSARQGNSNNKDKFYKILLPSDEWHKISVNITDPILFHEKQLRFNPLNTIGIIKISSINIVEDISNKILWAALEDDKIKTCEFDTNSILLDMKKTLHIFATKKNSQILFPLIPELPDSLMRLEIWIKVSSDLREVYNLLKESTYNKKDLANRVNALATINNKYEVDLIDSKNQLQLLARDNKKNWNQWESNKIDLLNKIYKLEKEIKGKCEIIDTYFLELSKVEQDNESKISRLNRQIKNLYKINKLLVHKIEKKENIIKSQKLFKGKSPKQHISEISKFRAYDRMYNLLFLKLLKLFDIENAGLPGIKPIINEKEFLTKCTIIIKLFLSFKETNHSINHDINFNSVSTNLMRNLIVQINSELKILILSKRLPLLNKIINLLSFGMCKIHNKTAMESLKSRILEMESILTELHLKPAELIGLMNQIECDFKGLISSRRWKLSHLDMYFFGLLNIDWNSSMLIERIEIIIEQFKILQEININV